MKSFTLVSQFYIPIHSNLTSIKPKLHKSSSRTIGPLLIDSERIKITLSPFEKLTVDAKPKQFELATKKLENLIPYSRYVIVGTVSVGFMMMLMGFDDHQKALAFGPEGPLMEDFWDNMRRYGLYALTVSSGVLYAVFQPLYELLKNPISAILVLTILGGGFYIVSQVVSAMVGITDFSYDYS